jgi:hypothetical protein
MMMCVSNNGEVKMKKTMTKKKADTDPFGAYRRKAITEALQSVHGRKRFTESLRDDIEHCRGSNAQKKEAREILEEADEMVMYAGQDEWDRGRMTITTMLERMTGVKFVV